MNQIASVERPQSLKVWQQSLREKHAEIDFKIVEETKRPVPDPMQMQTLKRARLKVKDELASIEGVLLTIGETGCPPSAPAQ